MWNEMRNHMESDEQSEIAFGKQLLITRVSVRVRIIVVERTEKYVERYHLA